jgi:ferric-dicitrate binding protein FerR (iron transport regulator)
MEHRSELFRLLSSLVDEQLSEEEACRLEELLADQEARRLYLQYVDLHARLFSLPNAGESTLPGVDALAGVIGSEAASVSPNMVRPGTRRHREHCSPRQRRGALQKLTRLWRYVAVAAATLAATILVQVALRPAHEAGHSRSTQEHAATYVATLVQAADAEWGPATAAYQPGARILAGEMELRKGIARLGYDGGIELIVEGPAWLRLESGMAATLLAGKVVFRADDASAPFTLSTPASVLVDLGTEYAVEVRAEQEEVHVFSGEVQRLAKGAQPNALPELLAAGDARRYGESTSASGDPAILEPAKFVRQLPEAAKGAANPAEGLLAYEGFDYADAGALRDEAAAGGSGFVGPWGGGFARAVNEKQGDRIALNIEESLTRASAPEASIGGSFEHVGFAKYFRRLAKPVRMDADGVYYFSFLFRREGPPLDALNDVSIQLRQTEELEGDQRDATTDLRKRLNFGVDRTNELYTHLERTGRRMPLPLSYGETYLLVAKVAASGTYPDQAFVRIYGPDEPMDQQEPASWSAVGPPIHSDLIFDWLEIHINSSTRQTIDEIRVGTTWASVTGPWNHKDAQNH